MGRKVHPTGFRLGINKPWLDIRQDLDWELTNLG